MTKLSNKQLLFIKLCRIVCLNKIGQRRGVLYPIEQGLYHDGMRPIFSWQTPRQLFWWDLWPTESKGGDKAIITNCLLRSIATVSDDYHVLYERKIPMYVLVGIPTLCQISTYDSRTMSAFFVGVCMGLIIYSHYQFLMNIIEKTKKVYSSVI